MTPVLIGKDLVLEGWNPKIEDKQVPGIYIYSTFKSGCQMVPLQAVNSPSLRGLRTAPLERCWYILSYIGCGGGDYHTGWYTLYIYVCLLTVVQVSQKQLGIHFSSMWDGLKCPTRTKPAFHYVLVSAETSLDSTKTTNKKFIRQTTKQCPTLPKNKFVASFIYLLSYDNVYMCPFLAIAIFFPGYFFEVNLTGSHPLHFDDSTLVLC